MITAFITLSNSESNEKLHYHTCESQKGCLIVLFLIRLSVFRNVEGVMEALVHDCLM